MPATRAILSPVILAAALVACGPSGSDGADVRADSGPADAPEQHDATSPEDARDAATPAAPLVLATGIGTAVCLAATEAYVFACEGTRLRRYPIAGGEATLVWTTTNDANLRELVVSGEDVFAEDRRMVHRSPVAPGGAGATIYTAGDLLTQTLAAGEGLVFAADGAVVVAIPAAGGAPRWRRRLENPRYSLAVGANVWIVDHIEPTNRYEVHLARAGNGQDVMAFEMTARPSFGPAPLLEHWSTDGTRMFVPRLDSANGRVTVVRYDNPPVSSGTTVVSTPVGELPASAVNGTAVDRADVVVSTGDGLYRLAPEGGADPVRIATGSPTGAVALHPRFVFWFDLQPDGTATLRGTPR